MPIEYQSSTTVEQQLQNKIQHYSQYVDKYKVNVKTSVFRSPKQYYRQRAEFRVWHEGSQCYFVMTDRQTRQLVRVDTLEIADLTINKLMQSLLNILNYIDILRQKLFSVEFLVNTYGDAVITLIYHKPLDSHWEKTAEGLQHQLNQDNDNNVVNIVGRSRKQKIVVGADYIKSSFMIGGENRLFCHVEGSFTQPNSAINQEMLSWVYEATNTGTGLLHDSDAMELYCGNGNFTLVLAANYRRVLATEISKSGINALNWSLKHNAIDNVKCVRLSAEEACQALSNTRPFRRLQEQDIDIDDYNFSILLVDPPRAGIDDKTLEFMKQFQRVIYISCNPKTFAENMEVLNATHSISKFAWFDQFPNTEHIELGAIIDSRNY